MRKFIDIVTRLDEKIVYRQRVPELPTDRPTVIAINPTKQEWDANFKRGAAGVIFRDGTICVGDGSCLAHDDMAHRAGLDIENEWVRLQMCRNVVWAELWLRNEDELLDEFGEEEGSIPREVIEKSVLDQYGATISEIENRMMQALSPFMGAVKMKAVPICSIDQECFFPEDDVYRQMCNKDCAT